MHQASPRRVAATAAIATALALASCNPGSSAVVATVDPAPAPSLSLKLDEPAADIRLAPTATLRFTFTANDSKGTAGLRLLADADGDLATVADQHELLRLPAAVRNGAETAQIPLANTLPLGSYALFGALGDGEPAVTAMAPGRLVVENDAPVEIPADPRLTLQVLEPALAVTASRGASLSVRLLASGPGSTAELRLYADTDGNPATTADRSHLATFPIPLGAASQAFSVPLTGVPVGSHRLLATMTTSGGLATTAQGPAAVEVVDRAFAVREGNGTYEEGRAVAVLPDGSLVVAGRFTGSTTLGVWPQVQHLNSLGDDDIFLCRYRLDGSLIWARRAGGPSRGDWPHAMAACSDGSFVVGGFFHGLAGLDGGSITTGLQSAGDDDAFVARYASDGTMLWARRAGGIFRDEVLGVAVLPDSSSIVTGSFTAQAIFGEAGAATTLLVQGSLLTSDGFVAKYTADGTLVWVRQFGGAAGDDAGRAVAVAADGSCVVTGVFRGSATFGSGPAQVTLTAAGGTDVFVARYDSAGALQWARRGGGVGDDEARGITIDSDGNCVAVGGFRGTATFADAALPVVVQAIGGLDGYVARYAADGALRSVRTVGGAADDEAWRVVATQPGGCIVSGHFVTTASFSGSAAPLSLVGYGSRDVFVARYDATGGLSWARAAGGTNHEQALGLAGAADGSFAITGVFHGAATFGLGARSRVLANLGWGDAFVVRYNADGDL